MARYVNADELIAYLRKQADDEWNRKLSNASEIYDDIADYVESMDSIERSDYI